MNTKRKSSHQESTSRMNTSMLFRMAGLSAVVAGLCAIVVGMFHPVNIPSSVTTAVWVNVHIAAIAMGFFGIFGLAGLYARQVGKAGWLGLAGFVLYSLWLALVMGFSLVEAFILPLLVTESPAFVEGFLGMFSGSASEIDMGILPTLWMISGPMYIFGPLLFAIATFRAAILPRQAAGLLAIGSLTTLLGAVLPPELEPKIMIPVGLALAWLGYALWSERRALTPEAVSEGTRPELSQTAAD
jgi:hypothetical protein